MYLHCTRVHDALITTIAEVTGDTQHPQIIGTLIDVTSKVAACRPLLQGGVLRAAESQSIIGRLTRRQQNFASDLKILISHNYQGSELFFCRICCMKCSRYLVLNYFFQITKPDSKMLMQSSREELLLGG
jgi:hypothetical protein